MKLVSVRELEEIEIYGKSIAVLYDIEDQLRPFPIYSKVKLLGKECMFYLRHDKELGQNVLVQVGCGYSEFWFGKCD